MEPPRSELSADITIPPGDIVNLPVLGREFGICFADPSVVANESPTPTLGTVGAKATLIFSAGEPSLSASSLNYATLALSTIETGGPSTSGILGPFDLSLWGGLVCGGHPTAAYEDWHGYIDYETTNNVTTGPWTVRARLPLWPGMELTAQLPRIERYGRISWDVYSGPFDPLATFEVVARPTITEILAVTPTLAGNPELIAWFGATNFYMPGDLVDGIDWAIDNTGANPVAVSTFGALQAGRPYSHTFAAEALGNTSIKGSFSEPFPLCVLTTTLPSGFTDGKIWMKPIIRPVQPDILGQITDTASNRTIPGYLQRANALLTPRAGIVGTTAVVTSPGGFGFNLAAASLPNTGVIITGGLITMTAPAGTYVSCYVGTAAAANTMIAEGYINPLTIAFGAPPHGITVPVGNNRIWYQCNAAGANVAIVLYTLDI
jgi:hypothetical protein